MMVHFLFNVHIGSQRDTDTDVDMDKHQWRCLHFGSRDEAVRTVMVSAHMSILSITPVER